MERNFVVNLILRKNSNRNSKYLPANSKKMCVSVSNPGNLKQFLLMSFDDFLVSTAKLCSKVSLWLATGSWRYCDDVIITRWGHWAEVNTIVQPLMLIQVIMSRAQH